MFSVDRSTWAGEIGTSLLPIKGKHAPIQKIKTPVSRGVCRAILVQWYSVRRLELANSNSMKARRVPRRSERLGVACVSWGWNGYHRMNGSLARYAHFARKK